MMAGVDMEDYLEGLPAYTPYDFFQPQPGFYDPDILEDIYPWSILLNKRRQIRGLFGKRGWGKRSQNRLQHYWQNHG